MGQWGNELIFCVAFRQGLKNEKRGLLVPWLYMCLGARAIFYSMHTAEWCGVVKAGIVKCNGTRARTIEEYLFPVLSFSLFGNL